MRLNSSRRTTSSAPASTSRDDKATLSHCERTTNNRRIKSAFYGYCSRGVCACEAIVLRLVLRTNPALPTRAPHTPISQTAFINRNNGRGPQDYHFTLLRTSCLLSPPFSHPALHPSIPPSPHLPHLQPFPQPSPTDNLLGPSNRFPPRNPLLRALQTIHAPPRRRNLRARPSTELDLRAVREPR
jgi:hypothetical protein